MPSPFQPFKRLVLSLLCYTPIHLHFRYLIMTQSSSVPTASAVESSRMCCQLVTAESRRPCDARRWLRAALVIVMLSSVCGFSTAQGTWSTGQLSVARTYMSATFVGNVAIFAGGAAGKCSFALFDGGFVLELLCVDDACLRRLACCLLVLCLRSRLPSDEGHCRCWAIL